MLLTPRSYRGIEDLRSVDAILSAGGRPGLCPYTVHPGDLRWWQFYAFPEDNRFEHLYLWEQEDGRPAAFTLLTVSEGAVDVFCLPELRCEPEFAHVLAWSCDRMTGLCRSAGQTQMFKWWNHPEDRVLLDLLTSLGFTLQEGETIVFVRSLERPIPSPRLPDGFRLRSARGLDELDKRAAVQHSAFESEIPMNEYLARFRSFLSSPVYNAEQDVVVEAPSGVLAAFAKFWLDPVTRMGQFEPVGTHTAYQRQGLGRAVLYEGMRRMKAAGALTARVGTGAANEPALQLYRNVGFDIAARLQTFARQI